MTDFSYSMPFARVNFVNSWEQCALIGICISLVVKFRFELNCDDEGMPTYQGRIKKK